MKVLRYKYALATAAACVCMFFACNNGKDYKGGKDSTAAPSTGDSAINKPDSATVGLATGKDSVTMAKATGKTTAAKPNPAKKGHKGIVRTAVYTPGYKAKMEADKDGVYNFTEVKPTFPGGEKELDKFIEDNIRYPEDALDNGVEGTVIVVFAINEKGKVFTPKLQNEKLGYGLDEEALAAVRKMPRWTPGRVKGKNVKSYYNLPITFTLAD